MCTCSSGWAEPLQHFKTTCEPCQPSGSGTHGLGWQEPASGLAQNLREGFSLQGGPCRSPPSPLQSFACWLGEAGYRSPPGDAWTLQCPGLIQGKKCINLLLRLAYYGHKVAGHSKSSCTCAFVHPRGWRALPLAPSTAGGVGHSPAALAWDSLYGRLWADLGEALHKPAPTSHTHTPRLGRAQLPSCLQHLAKSCFFNYFFFFFL